VPVDAIAEDLLGLGIHEVPLDGVSGLLYPSERIVFLNANDTLARGASRWHTKVGRWVCQCLQGRGAPMLCRAEDVAADRTLEREANIFVAELLMPDAAVHAAADDANAAMRFGVSGEAMQWHRFRFGLIEEKPA
jgi:IrrE N-terminal-like domain